MDLGNIINDRATAQATFLGETLDFKYRPGMITPTSYARLQDEQSVDELATFFAGVIVSWNLTEKRDGEAVTLDVTEDVIKRLPMGLIRALTHAVMADVPQREVGNESSGS